MLGPKARPKAEACLYSERLACWVRVRVKSVTPNPTTATRTQAMRHSVGAPLRHIYTYAEALKGGATADGSGNLRRELRPTAAEGTKGGATADGSGRNEGRRHARRQRKERREAPRPTAAESFGGHHGRRLQAATARDTPRSPPQPPSVTSPFESSRSHRPQHPPKTPAATVRNASLRELPQPPSATPSEDPRSHRP